MSDKGSQNKQWAELAVLGIVFPLCIVAGFLLGRGMDNWFGTYPWCTGIMTLLGIAAAFVNLFRAGMKNDGSGPGTDGP